MIERLLVANRGEIASRVFRTCRRLGIGCVAVHSDADAGLPFVREADLAVRLPGSTPAQTYLRADLVIEAARRAGADAIHPGYGFLSENPDFARAVIEAGLVWVGPSPDSIEKMGSKIEAKRIMAAAGVPVLEAPPTPTEADLPLLVKASAGGGGRGMRIVRSLDVLEDEIAAAKAEAASAFGDGTVFIEPYVENGRHVEVQVVSSVVVGDRDCSLQRRHQKVVEEAPAPGLPESVRESMHAAARAAAEAIDYRGAGTVEFLYDPASERFWFLEMNTRLQVEHPVTELVHGVDLVELQLRVAESDWFMGWFDPPQGHAMEARLYAEDPAADYQPQSGVLTAFDFPDATDVRSTGVTVRVDAGYETDSTVSTFYDAMLAKVIVHAPDRDQAARALAGVLRRARIHGLVTNREQLIDVLGDRRFLRGEVSTALLSPPMGERVAGEAVGAPPQSRQQQSVATAAALALAEAAAARRTVQQRIPVGWRNVPSQPQRTEFVDGPSVEWWGTRDGYRVDGVEVIEATPERVVLEVDGLRTAYAVAIAGDRVDVDSAHGHTALVRRPRFTDPASAVAQGSLLAPMPGTVVKLAAEVGERLVAGAPVLVLEAMKMQHTVSAPTDGVLTQVNVRAGAQVAAGEVLAVVTNDGDQSSVDQSAEQQSGDKQ